MWPLWHLLIRFEITVNYSIAVKVFQSKHRLSKIHPLNKIQSIKHYLFNKYNFNPLFMKLHVCFHSSSHPTIIKLFLTNFIHLQKYFLLVHLLRKPYSWEQNNTRNQGLTWQDQRAEVRPYEQVWHSPLLPHIPSPCRDVAIERKK